MHDTRVRFTPAAFQAAIFPSLLIPLPIPIETHQGHASEETYYTATATRVGAAAAGEGSRGSTVVC